eukprot:TRINITY_DN46791_c0_g1_i1.p1 TRINITY_DN46791_c0_g1~~TRINITY_DN46791_c0_g1_i1.p1  ORF type:complete len:626 (+),score=158.42 TRINITY_DN46791_c0_g1_i1:106-1878(+)
MDGAAPDPLAWLPRAVSPLFCTTGAVAPPAAAGSTPPPDSAESPGPAPGSDCASAASPENSPRTADGGAESADAGAPAEICPERVDDEASEAAEGAECARGSSSTSLRDVELRVPSLQELLNPADRHHSTRLLGRSGSSGDPRTLPALVDVAAAEGGAGSEGEGSAAPGTPASEPPSPVGSEVEARIMRESREGDTLLKAHTAACHRGCLAGLLLCCCCMCRMCRMCRCSGHREDSLNPDGPGPAAQRLADHSRTGAQIGFAAGLCISGLLLGSVGFALCMHEPEDGGIADTRFAGLVMYLIGIVCAHTAHRRWLIFSQRWDAICPPPRGAVPGGRVATTQGTPQPRCGCLPVCWCGRTADFAHPFPLSRPAGVPRQVARSDYSQMAAEVNAMREKTQQVIDFAPLFCILCWSISMGCFAAEMLSRDDCSPINSKCVWQWVGVSTAPSFFVTVLLWKGAYCCIRARCLRRVGAFLELHAERTGLATQHNMRWVIRNPPYARCHAAPVLWLVMINPERRAAERLGWRDAFSTHCSKRFRSQVRAALRASLRLRSQRHSSALGDDLLFDILGYLPQWEKYKPYPTLSDRLGS